MQDFLVFTPFLVKHHNIKHIEYVLIAAGKVKSRKLVTKSISSSHELSKVGFRDDKNFINIELKKFLSMILLLYALWAE